MKLAGFVGDDGVDTTVRPDWSSIAPLLYLPVRNSRQLRLVSLVIFSACVIHRSGHLHYLLCHRLGTTLVLFFVPIGHFVPGVYPAS